MFGSSTLLSLLTLTLGSTLVHFYLWRRIVRDNEWEHSIASGLTLTLIATAVLIPLIRILSRLVSNDGVGVMQGLAMTFLLFAFYVAALIVLWDLARWVHRTYKGMSRPAFDDSLNKAKYVLLFQEHNTLATGPGRFWNRIGTVIIILVAFAITAKGFFGAFRSPEVVESGITSPRIPPELSGFRILHLSDLHLSVFFNDSKFDTLVEKIDQLHPDMIVITGDIVDASNKKLKHGFERLGELTAPYGVFAVLGNHDGYAGADNVAAGLSGMGFIVLRNSALPIHIGKQTLCISGVDDESFAHRCADCGPNIDQALMACPKNSTRILLTHQPKTYADWVSDADRTETEPNVVFAGHTHGGQAWPFQWVTEFLQTYVSGTYYETDPAFGNSKEPARDTAISVSNGIGISAPLARIGAPPGMTMFTLNTAAAAPVVISPPRIPARPVTPPPNLSAPTINAGVLPVAPSTTLPESDKIQ